VHTWVKMTLSVLKTVTVGVNNTNGKNMKISIITATFNSEKTLARCIQSVACQTAIESIEHIIVDGKSRDSTIAIVSEYPHIAKIISEPDRGIYHAFNKGIDLATGDIIYFLNSDDRLYDNEVIADVLASFTDEIDFYSAKVLLENPETGQTIVNPIGKNSRENYKKTCHQAFFCRKRAFDEIGLFNECLSIAADAYMMKKLITSKHGIFSERITAFFQLGGISSQHENTEKLKIEDYVVDALLENKIEGTDTHSKLAYGMLTLKDIRGLFLRFVSDKVDFSIFENKKIAIFGAHEVSKIIYSMLEKNNFDVYGLVISDKRGARLSDDYKLYDLSEIKGKNIDLIINCIEGEHESSISEKLGRELDIQVISWRKV